MTLEITHKLNAILASPGNGYSRSTDSMVLGEDMHDIRECDHKKQWKRQHGSDNMTQHLRVS